MGLRLRFFYAGDFASLWREAQPPDHSKVRVPSTRSDFQTAKQLEALLGSQEFAKAIAQVRRSQEYSPPGKADFDKLTALFPKLPSEVVGDVAEFLGRELPGATRAKLELGIVKSIVHAPKASGGGPGDSKFEHWTILEEHPEGLTKAGIILARLLVGEVPAPALAAHLSARLIALPQPKGGGPAVGMWERPSSLGRTRLVPGIQRRPLPGFRRNAVRRRQEGGCGKVAQVDDTTRGAATFGTVPQT